jgi:hypothetical protein
VSSSAVQESRTKMRNKKKATMTFFHEEGKEIIFTDQFKNLSMAYL